MRPPVPERVLGTLCLAALVVSCGGSPAAPSAGQPVVLPAGDYTLGIGTGGDTREGILCMTVGAGAPGSIVIEVRVETADGGWVVRAEAGTLTMRLTPSGRHVTGRVSGTARGNDGTGVTLGWSDGLEAYVVGEPIDASTVRGSIDGPVSFSSAGGSYGCSDNAWILAPR